MPDNILRIGAEFDVSNLVAGAQIAGTSMDELGTKVGEANAEMLAALYPTAAEDAALEKLAVDEDAAAAGTGRIAGAMGMARVEAGALTGSTGMVVGGFARLAAASEALGPIIQAAFAPIAIAAFGEILFDVGEKLVKLYDNLVLDKEELEAFGRIAKQTAEYTQRLVDETERAYISYLKIIDPIEAAREALRNLSNERFTFKIDEKDVKVFTSMDEKFSKFVKELSDFPASQLDEQITRVAGSIEYLQQKLAAPVLRGPLDRTELQAELDELNRLKAAMDQFGQRQGVQQRLGGADLDKEKEQAARKAAEAGKAQEEAAYRAFQALNEQQELAARGAEQEQKQIEEVARKRAEAEQKVIENYYKEFDATQSVQEEITKDIQKELENRTKYELEQEKQSEEISLKRISMRELEVTRTARDRMAKRPKDVESPMAQAESDQTAAAREVEQLKALEDQKLAIEMDYLEKRKAILLGSQAEQQFKSTAEGSGNYSALTQLQELNSQIEAAQAQHVARMQALDDQLAANSRRAADAIQQAYMKAFQPINSGFQQVINGLMQGTVSISVAFQRMGQQLVMHIVDSFAQMILRQIEYEAMTLMVHATTTQAKVAVTASGEAETTAIESAAQLKSVGRAAGTAAAHAFSAVMAAVPFPLDVVLAPAAAAAAFSSVMAVGMMGSAEKGAVIPQDMPVNLHAEEMVLPKPISTGLRAVIPAMAQFGAAMDDSASRGGIGAAMAMPESITATMPVSLPGEGGAEGASGAVGLSMGSVILPSKGHPDARTVSMPDGGAGGPGGAGGAAGMSVPSIASSSFQSVSTSMQRFGSVTSEPGGAGRGADASIAGGPGGGETHNYHMNWNALDSKSVADFLHNPGNRAQFTKMLRQTVRNGVRLR